MQTMQAISQRRVNWWDRTIHGGQHVVFRLVSLVFSVVSAWAIYWFFSALGDDLIQRVVTVGTSAGFAALGYFVMRGLAHRILAKRRIRSYMFIALLYVLVEVACNFAHAAARYPDVQWIHHLQGWQFGLFSFLLPVVLSIIPLFNIALAVIDVDLMLEKGMVPAHPVTAQPKVAALSGMPTMSLGSLSGQARQQGQSVAGLVPQASYPSLSSVPQARGQAVQAAQGQPNALKSWWSQRNQGQKPVVQSMQSGQGVRGAGIP